MKRIVLFFATLLMLALAACQSEPSMEQVADEGDETIVTVYHIPT